MSSGNPKKCRLWPGSWLALLGPRIHVFEVQQNIQPMKCKGFNSTGRKLSENDLHGYGEAEFRDGTFCFIPNFTPQYNWRQVQNRYTMETGSEPVHNTTQHKGLISWGGGGRQHSHVHVLPH